MEYRSNGMSDTLEATLPTRSLSLQTKEEEKDGGEAMSMGVVRHLPSPLLAS